MPMKNPCHGGELILHDWIGGLELTVEAAAEHMQVSAESLEDICEGKASVTTKMAERLSKALGSIPRFWIQLQVNYEAAQAEAMLVQFNIKRIERVA
ncbi:MAG: HigA family addiction module antitoxin [Chloroflexi bacterium]|nr:HigA family addiction module antitoxin [Chloroflexota bacterium]